jgi:hypothetical protein
MKLLIGLLFAVALCFGGVRAADAAVCAPAKLEHIRITNVTPGIDPSSFNGQPQDMYRLGDGKMRSEEAVDSINKIHGLLVTNEPNIWMVNLYDKTGKHIVDPGPTFYAKAPIAGIIPSKKLMSLEFGCEGDFIAAYAPTPARSEVVGSVMFDVFRVADGTDAVEILERPGSNVPSYVRYFQNGAPAFMLRYDLYETNLPDDPSLFAKPADIKYTEAGG